MKNRVLFAVAVVGLGLFGLNAAGLPQQPNKTEEKVKPPFLDDKVKFDLWEKTYPIKIKSVSCSKLPAGTYLKFLCQYTEDDKGTKENPPKVKANGIIGILKGVLYFFDEDGVILGTANEDMNEGQHFEGRLTGVKGDSFRYCVPIPKQAVGAKRVELREK